MVAAIRLCILLKSFTLCMIKEVIFDGASIIPAHVLIPPSGRVILHRGIFLLVYSVMIISIKIILELWLGQILVAGDFEFRAITKTVLISNIEIIRVTFLVWYVLPFFVKFYKVVKVSLLLVDLELALFSFPFFIICFKFFINVIIRDSY